MRFRLADLHPDLPRDFEPGSWPGLLEAEGEFPVPLRRARLLAATRRGHPPWAAFEVEDQAGGGGQLVCLDFGTEDHPRWRVDVIRWEPTPGPGGPRVEVRSWSPRRPVPSGPLHGAVGRVARVHDGILELGGEGVGRVEHADPDWIWIRRDLAGPGLLEFHRVADLREVREGQASVREPDHPVASRVGRVVAWTLGILLAVGAMGALLVQCD